MLALKAEAYDQEIGKLGMAPYVSIPTYYYIILYIWIVSN